MKPQYNYVRTCVHAYKSGEQLLYDVVSGCMLLARVFAERIFPRVMLSRTMKQMKLHIRRPETFKSFIKTFHKKEKLFTKLVFIQAFLAIVFR